MTTYNNYSISASKGSLYLKSSTPKEGYEKVIYGTNNDKVTYHQYKDKITGVPDKLEYKTIEHQQKKIHFLELSFKEQDGIVNKISVVAKNKGTYTDEARTLISALYNIKLNEEVTFTPKINTYTNKKGVTKTGLSLYINYSNILKEDGNSESTGFIPFADIPRADVKEVAGESVYNWDEQTEFFYDKLQEIIGKFASTQSSPNNNTPKQETNQSKPAVAESTSTVEEDDLPF